MSLFGRLLMTERPVLPAGGQYILDTGDNGDGWVIRLQMPDQPDSRRCPVVGPHFTVLEKADEYREWLEGTREHFDYGTGPV